MSSRTKIRYAVVGTGWFAQAAVLPGFRNAANSTLEAIVSGDPVKRQALGKTYGVSAHSYEEYESLLASGRIDAVYIVLPNSLHREYTLAAAKHKIHVLCEKPLAASVAECREMIAACRENKVRLMTAYRLHLESANLAAIELLEGGKIGERRAYHGMLTQQVREGNTRLRADTAGNPLTDLGIYCINAARYLFQDDPVEVSAFVAWGSDPRFEVVPEMVTGMMRFPGDRLATFACGFGEASVSEYRVIGTKGDLRLEDAFTFQDGATMHATVDGETETTKFDSHDQVGAEIDYFADCILNDVNPEPDGNEGLIDMMIVEAIEQSYKTGRTVELGGFPEKIRPAGDQEYKFSPTKKPELVNAASPEPE